MIYNLDVKDRVITHPFNDNLIQSGVESDSIKVTFDSEWSSMSSRRAVFANGDEVVGLLFGASNPATIQIPWEALKNAGHMYVSFIGYAGSKRIVTRIMDRPFIVSGSGRIEGSEERTPTPDEIQTLINALESSAVRANTSANAANTAATSATTAAASANSAAKTANESSTKANTAATTATNAASAATTAKDAANTAATSATTAAASANSAADTAIAAAGKADLSSSNADTATGRANSAADEAEAFLEGFVVNYSNLSDECKALIAQSAGTGAAVISDAQGVGIIDDLAAVIVSGRDAGCLTNKQGVGIIDDLF